MNTWRATDRAGRLREFRSSDFDEYELADKLPALPIEVVDVTDGNRHVCVILPNDDIESAFRIRVQWAKPSELGREALARRVVRTVRIVRGTLSGEPWGYDILDSHLQEPVVIHLGSLEAAESYAEGYARALHDEGGHDVEIRIGPEGMSSRKALLEP